ncbi:MAG: RHS repeat domain-containing protein [Candidatus Spyradosoma sp.]
MIACFLLREGFAYKSRAGAGTVSAPLENPFTPLKERLESMKNRSAFLDFSSAPRSRAAAGTSVNYGYAATGGFRAAPAGTCSITYNAQNRPVSFRNDATDTLVECAYDYRGRRCTKKVTVAGTVVLHQRYIYREYLQIACVDLTRAAHPALWLVLWDPTRPTATRPLAIQKDGSWFTYGHDVTKNVWEVFGPSGYVRTSYDYAPFGAVTASGDVTQPFQWSSEFYDSELGLVYYNYRHYSPTDGRFLSRDPIEEQGGLNLYVFVRNIPTQFSDTLGQSLFGLDFDYTSSLQVGGCLPIPAAPGVSICLTGGYTVTVGECCQGCAKKRMTEISGDINISVSFGVPSLLSLSYTHGVVIESDNPPKCPTTTGGIKGSAFVGFNFGFANGQCTYDMSKDSWSCSTSLQFNPQFNVYGGGAINFYKIIIQ